MWEKELNTARQSVKAGGEILGRLFGQVNHIIKKGDIDLVTEADFQVESAILDTIQQNFPRDTILSEEAGKKQEVSGRTWIVDPLDGTTNFAHGFPIFAISIALELDNEIVLGAVYNPQMDEYFEAVKGMGAYLNEIPIQVSTTSDIEESLLATGFAYNIHENPHRVLKRFHRMIVRAQGIRRPGSAAIDLCYVAAGKLDGFWEEGLKPWDTAAGFLIVDEAGGKVTTMAGETYSPYLKTIVAANPFVHAAMIDILNQ
jgi:myo-inositol-1(or 4)-monophosphatase